MVDDIKDDSVVKAVEIVGDMLQLAEKEHKDSITTIRTARLEKMWNKYNEGTENTPRRKE